MEEDFDQDAPEEEDFATLFESYANMGSEDLREGDKVDGRIIAIGEDAVFVDTGGKIDGVVDKAELLNGDGELPYSEGDRIELYVVAVSEGEVRLSRALSGAGGLNLLKEAYASQIPVEGRVTQTCKGGFNVEVLHRRAFCPISQMDLRYVETADKYVGQTHHFLISQFEEKGKNIVVTRRRLLEREQEENAKQFLKTVHVGSVLEGRVTKLAPYGAFIELAPGVEGMAHISELSWSRIENSAEAVAVNQTVPVKILDIKDDDKSSRKKIALSVKQVEGDPWDTAAERFKIGQKIQGKVIRCVKFGVFVEIAPGIEGLVHISEMSYVKRVVKPQDLVSSGEQVFVIIKDFDLEKRRIGLSMRDAEGDPWAGVSEKYRPGQSVEGLIEKKEAFGFFVTLEPGVTGLLPKSTIGKAARPAEIEKLKEGDAVRVVVEKVDAADRKISLSPSDSAEESSWGNFLKDGKTSMNPLAEKLARAFEKKK